MICVGARGVMIAYNLYVDATLKTAAGVAKAIRSPSVRALAFQVGDEVQVSCNLIAPQETSPEAVDRLVAVHTRITRTEVVGLRPKDLYSKYNNLRRNNLRR